MALDSWQTRLHQHFTALAKERVASGHPVFALEHNLGNDEIESLEADVRASLKVRPPSDAFWLPWVVYATEVGYKYDGEEYWRTFRQITPGWSTCRSKPEEWLRGRFVGFHKTYHGIQPSGPWAAQFSIIAWPIQHAILPAYLQFHLAKLLYNLRFHFTAKQLADSSSLGEYIHAESGQSVKRLQEFTEEHALVGTIASALLLSGSETSNVALLPGTLKRLITDLESKQDARNWLHGAQDEVRRISLRGIARTAREDSTSRSGTSRTAPVISKREIPEIECHLFLSPASPDVWNLYLETPDLTSLITRFPRFREVLSGSRCAVGSASAQYHPRGWLLSGPYHVPLTAWPQPGEVLFRLDKGDPEMDAIMRTDFLLRPGPTWLFKIGTDGLAYEVRSRTVRAGHRYVMLSAGAIPIRAPATVIDVRCSRIAAARIVLPDALDENTCSYLESLGLNVWQTIRVWPVGLTAPVWDGEGWAEWLVTDRICVGIASDQPMRSVALALDGLPSQRFDNAQSNAAIIVELPQMPLGLHELRIVVQNAGPNPAEHAGLLEFLVRSPKARLDAYQALFRVSVDPERASLDDLWRGAVNIEVHGPAGRTVTPRIELCSATGADPLVRKVLPAIAMPAPATTWKMVFREHCDGHPELDDHFDDAKFCTLAFDAGELGTSVLLFEHARRPLRWVIERKHNVPQLRLVNEGPDAEATVVSYHTFNAPDQPMTLSAGQQYEPIVIADRGGLWLASCGAAHAGIIVPPTGVPKGLAGLGTDPQLVTHQGANGHLGSLVVLYELWATARVIHDFRSFNYRRQVLNRIESAIFDLMYGEASLGDRKQWSNAKTSGGYRPLLQSIANSIPNTSVRSMIGVLATGLLRLPTEKRAEYFAHRLFPLVSYSTAIPAPAHCDGESWMAEFALRLASAPDTLGDWASDGVSKGLQFLLQYKTIVKAARFIVLTGEVGASPKPLSAGRRYEQWDWA
jgi:hypothetical protein